MRELPSEIDAFVHFLYSRHPHWLIRDSLEKRSSVWVDENEVLWTPWALQRPARPSKHCCIPFASNRTDKKNCAQYKIIVRGSD